MTGSAPTDVVSKAQIFELLSALYPNVALHRSAPLIQYAESTFKVSRWQTTSAIRKSAMTRLCRAIERTAEAQGTSSLDAATISDSLYELPVMQTGPHLHLLIEPDAFYTHLFSLLGLRSNKKTSYISYGCSTVKFVERGRKGPGWLTIEGLGINVFGLSRSKMIPYSILARNRSYRFELQNADRVPSCENAIEALRANLPVDEFASAATAIKVANRLLWSKAFAEDVKWLQFDDEDVADLVADHLDDPTSWLSLRLFTEPALAQSVIDHIERLRQTPWREWLKNSTHFFWGNDNGRLFPLTLRGRDFHSADGEKAWISLSPPVLSDALRQRRVIPNLFTMFLVTAMMPGIRVLGGSRHAIYYPLMRYAFCSALFEVEEGFELLAALCWDERPTVWGHRVLQDDLEPAAMVGKLDFASIQELCDRYGAARTFEACGTLSSFCDDPLWEQLYRTFKAGQIGPRSPQWCFA